jgi:hypothetical protein
VDCKAEFGLATRGAADAFFRRFYSDANASDEDMVCVAKLAAQFSAHVPDGVFSMAKLQAHLMRYRHSPEEATTCAKTLHQADLLL